MDVTKSKERGVKGVQSSKPGECCGQWCLNGRPQCTNFRLARRRESLGVQRMADVPLQPLSGWEALVLDGTKCLQDCRSSRSYRKTRVAMEVSTPELQRNYSKLQM